MAEGLYRADEQMRGEVYNWGSFVESRMHAQGVTCSDCHDPHTQVLHAWAVGAPGARDALQTITDDRAQPAIVRAKAIDRLARWLTPDTLSSAAYALGDPDPLVRLAAVEALATTDSETRLRYLPRMLSDPVRSVRIEAARVRAGPGEGRLPAARRDAFVKALAEYTAVQTYNADRPEGHLNLGNLYARRGDTDRALAEF